MYDFLIKESKNFFIGNVYFKIILFIKVIINFVVMVNCCKIIKLIKVMNLCSFIYSYYGEYVDNVILL